MERNGLAVMSPASPPYVYFRGHLLALYTKAFQPSPVVVERVRSLGL